MVTFLKAQAWLNSPEQKAPPQAQVLVVVAAHDKVLNTLARLSKILESSSPHQAQDLAVVAVRDILFTALGLEAWMGRQTIQLKAWLES